MKSTLSTFRRIVSGSIVAALVTLGAVHCGGGSSGVGGSGDGCSTVCQCVGAKGGSITSCMSQCQQVEATTKDPKGDCESALAANGYSSCNSTCSAFGSAAPAPSTSASAGASGDTASIADFCQKCASCVVDPTFDEGFCTPDKLPGGGYDVASCTSAARVSELKNPNLTTSELASLSCAAFDAAE